MLSHVLTAIMKNVFLFTSFCCPRRVFVALILGLGVPFTTDNAEATSGDVELE
jgi:hypothetical protein